MFGMSLTLWATGGPIGVMRPQVERIETGRYLASSYYERWEHALEVMLAERGVLAPADVDRGSRRCGPAGRCRNGRIRRWWRRCWPTCSHDRPRDRRAAIASRPDNRCACAASRRRCTTAVHATCAASRASSSGCCAPDWLPENEDLGEQRRAPCYTVSFAAADLWPDDGADHTVLVDLWETYLEEAV